MSIRELKKSAKASLRGNWGIAIGAMVLFSVIAGGIGGIIGFVDTIINAQSLAHDPFDPTMTNQIFSVGNVLMMLVSIFVTGPLMMGLLWINLDIYDGKKAEINGLFEGYKGYWRVVSTYLLMYIFISLWTLLLIVPGIIKGISYSQAYYIIRENPEMSAMEAIKESQRLMRGNKGKYFLTNLSFIGWVIVPIIVLILSSSYVIIGVAAQLAGYVVSHELLIFSVLGLIVSGLYLFAISFYLYPYFLTTISGFYRELVRKDKPIHTGSVLDTDLSKHFVE